MKLRNKVWLASAFAVVVILVVVSQHGAISTWVQERPYREALPSAIPAADFTNLPVAPDPSNPAGPQAAPRPSANPASMADINLAVPFAPQAPFANWDQPYQDACEEATIIMVERFFTGRSLSLEQMDAEILALVDFQNEQYGFFKDSNIAETVRLIEAFHPSLQAKAHYDVTAEDIQKVLAKGTPVVVLVDGRRLNNPFYTQPGPDKHTLVIKGVKGDKFITNDPGTKRGADFLYPFTTVLGAMVDYDGATPGTGKRAIIVITPRS